MIRYIALFIILVGFISVFVYTLMNNAELTFTFQNFSERQASLRMNINGEEKYVLNIDKKGERKSIIEKYYHVPNEEFELEILDEENVMSHKIMINPEVDRFIYVDYWDDRITVNKSENRPISN